MTPEQTPQEPAPQEQVWGAPQPAAQRPAWTAKKTIAAVAIAVGITAAGGVAIYAASGTNRDEALGGGQPPGGGMRIMGPGFGDTTHGEFQTGQVTSINDASLEVKSTDGYTRTYVIDAETVIEGVQQGDTVTVIADTEDGRTVASSVIEPGQRGQRGQQTPPAK